MTEKKFDREQFRVIWKDMVGLIDQIFDAAEVGVERHTDLFNDILDHEDLERHLMKDIFNLIQKKWMLNIVNALAFHNYLYFNEIKKHVGKISSKTLSERLKELLELNIIIREVEDDFSPVRVKYSLTKFGEGLHHSLLPFVIYYFTNNNLNQ